MVNRFFIVDIMHIMVQPFDLLDVEQKWSIIILYRTYIVEMLGFWYLANGEKIIIITRHTLVYIVMKEKSGLVIGLAIAIVLLIGAIIGGSAIRHRNDGPKTISVKGGAQMDFVSDLVVWEIIISSHSYSPIDGLKDVDRQRVILHDFLTQKGVTEEELVFGPVSYNEVTKGYYDSRAERYIEQSDGYNVEQTATITSLKVDDVEKIARSMGDLIEKDVRANAMLPRYYYTKLADLKLEMVAAASADAKERAEAIAKESGCKVGKLRRSSLGVFQIVALHADEAYSWGGNYNTSSKEKTVSITVSSEFLVE